MKTNIIMHFVLENKIPEALWREIKTYLVHDIKIQSKYMKNEKEIHLYNRILDEIPRIKLPEGGPVIVYNNHVYSSTFRIVKFLYHVCRPGWKHPGPEPELRCCGGTCNIVEWYHHRNHLYQITNTRDARKTQEQKMAEEYNSQIKRCSRKIYN